LTDTTKLVSYSTVLQFNFFSLTIIAESPCIIINNKLEIINNVYSILKILKKNDKGECKSSYYLRNDERFRIIVFDIHA